MFGPMRDQAASGRVGIVIDDGDLPPAIGIRHCRFNLFDGFLCPQCCAIISAVAGATRTCTGYCRRLVIKSRHHVCQ